MWYFTWILGLGFALLLGLCNLLWLEARWQAAERDGNWLRGKPLLVLLVYGGGRYVSLDYWLKRAVNKGAAVSRTA